MPSVAMRLTNLIRLCITMSAALGVSLAVPIFPNEIASHNYCFSALYVFSVWSIRLNEEMLF